MQNPSQDPQRTTSPSAHLSEPLRQDQTQKEKRPRDEYCENADIKDTAVVWIDSTCVDKKNTAEQRQAVTLMRRIYRQARRTIPWIGLEVENGSRKIKFSSGTAKTIAFGCACLCAIQLMQKPLGKSRTVTGGIEKSLGGATACSSSPSRWSANAQDELLLEFGDRRTLLNALRAEYASLPECVHIPAILSRPPPLLLLITSVVFAFPITYLRHTNRRDKYQDEIIVGCMILTIAVASMFGDVWEIAVPLLPWSIIIGLVLSSSIHRVFGFREEKR
ncbi:hypothetical protein IFR05_008181 [Cadophora sp. M221]|nr:hypothetical protein IFR05_008181 [Cadophora sp. M221]